MLAFPEARNRIESIETNHPNHRVLSRLGALRPHFRTRVYPTIPVGDHFCSQRIRIGPSLTQQGPGKPTDNAYVDSFNGTLRAECLNAYWFATLAEADQGSFDSAWPRSGLRQTAPLRSRRLTTSSSNLSGRAIYFGSGSKS
jgi:hypothetical protein